MSNIVPLSVVIPTLNRHTTLIQTVNSICSGESIPSQIIIIDQSKTPVKHEDIDVIEGTEVVIEHSTVASSTRARNIGIAKSKENIILFCDDDILLDEYSIKTLMNRISKPENALVSGIHYKDNAYYTSINKTSDITNFLGTLCGFKKFWRNDGYVIKHNMRGRYSSKIVSESNTEWAMGYFFCIKREILNNLEHYFDENLIRYAYAEDLDFTYRYCRLAKKLGLTTIVDPTIYVNHLASKEWRVPKQEEINYLFINRRYLSWKLFPKRWDYRVAMDFFDYLYLISQIKNKEYATKILYSLRLCNKNKNFIKQGMIEKVTKIDEV